MRYENDEYIRAKRGGESMSIEKLVDIFALVCYICATICIISLIVTVVFESNTAACITVITFFICLLVFIVEMGLILWDMLEW